jgi:ribosomal protein S17E
MTFKCVSLLLFRENRANLTDLPLAFVQCSSIVLLGHSCSAQSIIRTISRIIEEKNTDEVIQDFLHTTRGVDVGINAVTTKIIKHVTGSVTIKYIQDDKAEAIKQLQTLGRLIMSNSEFRKVNILTFGAIWNETNTSSHVMVQLLKGR